MVLACLVLRLSNTFLWIVLFITFFLKSYVCFLARTAVSQLPGMEEWMRWLMPFGKRLNDEWVWVWFNLIRMNASDSSRSRPCLWGCWERKLKIVQYNRRRLRAEKKGVKTRRIVWSEVFYFALFPSNSFFEVRFRILIFLYADCRV